MLYNMNKKQQTNVAQESTEVHRAEGADGDEGREDEK